MFTKCLSLSKRLGYQADESKANLLSYANCYQSFHRLRQRTLAGANGTDRWPYRLRFRSR